MGTDLTGSGSEKGNGSNWIRIRERERIYCNWIWIFELCYSCLLLPCPPLSFLQYLLILPGLWVYGEQLKTYPHPSLPTSHPQPPNLLCLNMSLSLSPSLLSISFSISLSAPSPNGVGPCWLPVWGGGGGGNIGVSLAADRPRDRRRAESTRPPTTLYMKRRPRVPLPRFIRKDVPLPRSIWKDDHASRYHALHGRTTTRPAIPRSTRKDTGRRARVSSSFYTKVQPCFTEDREWLQYSY